MVLGLAHDLCSRLPPLLVALGKPLVESSGVWVVWGFSIAFVPVLWCSVTVVADVMYRLWVAVVAVTVAWPWSFIWLCHFPLLLELLKVLNFWFAKFCKLIIRLQHYFGLFPYQMVVQWSYPQRFYDLSYDLLIKHLWYIGFELKEPSIESGNGSLSFWTHERKSSSVSSSTWNPWKLRRILSFSCCHE
jgi:hypothetical protein